ncbi:MAG: beta strand repeat-containing protein, partial [Sandaracinaceae bacterium]
EMIGGLTPATTYYYCAIASNALGTAFGSVVTFTTPSAPTVTTNAASSVTSTGATLNGAGVAHLTATTGYFRYSATDPGTCNDTFGSRAPVTGGSSLGSGSSSVSFSQSVGSLSSGTTYYYCAIANNMEGTAFGAVLSFTTLAAPTVTTATASSVTSTTATLNGSANPNGASATGWYRYSTTNPGSCNDTFGMRAPATSGTLLGAGMADVPFPRAITGLTPGATYYYCAIASNSAGTGYGSVLSFTALAAAPTVSTNAASGLTTTSATLNGSANPNGASTTGWFRMDTVSPGTCNDTFGTRVPASGGTSLGAGNASVAYSQTVAVTAGTTYYYCALAANSVDTSFGAVRTFTAPAPPTTNTFAATPVTATTATLNGNVNPNGFTTTGWFRYSTTDPGTCSDTFGTRAPSSGGSSLGAGTVATSYGQAITGLSPATTYYFCAIASSSIGTTFGSVLSFTTPAAPPTVTTIAASSIAPTGAVLNATANPNGSSTTGWFRYSTTNPGACNDTFGTRTPTTGGTSLGMGSAASPYSATLTGLTLGQTYYFCALAQNAIGTSVGTVLTFTTTAAPTVTTNAASAITSTGATLNGAANPNAATTTGWFRYSTTDPGACNDTFGTRAPTTGGTALGAGTTPSTYSRALTGLTAGTTYYFCAIASSASGTGFGSVLSFVTPGAPSVTTDPATSITSSGATLHGTANPNSSSATGYFRYATTSPGTCNDTFGTRAPSTGGATLGSGTTPVSYAQPIIGLAGGTTYYYCAIANNAIGTRFGTVSSFTTPASPTVTTSAASSISGAGATLNGSANPNLAAATGWFRYATTSPGTCNDTFGTRTPVSGGASLGAGSSSVPYSQAVSGLTAGTTYYFCAIASNAAGTAFGSVMSFTTPGAPTVTTLAATSVTTTGATLNGSANPNLSDATGWFRFSTTNPGTCNDAFGTRAPTSGAATLGAGSSAVPYSQALTGLAGGTTYYFCAIASNAEGLRFGSVLSFSTPAAPGVTTLAATSVSSAGATLNATGTANGAATTGWFRYAPSDPGACNDTFGTRSPATGGTSLGSGSTATPFSQTLGGLLPGTTYYFCAIAQNGVGTSFGSLLTFTTSAAPTVTTVGASAITSTTATLDGSANPNLNAATGWFRYATSDPGVCNDTFGTRAPATGGTSLGSGSTSVPYSQALTGLTSGATYYYCAIASNSVGTAVGTVRSFTTLAAPTVTTDPASMLSSTGATLRGSANPNASASTGWFRYATTNPGTCDDTFGTRTPASGGTSLGGGSGVVPYQQTLTGLSPLTTYYYCAIASSSVGTGLGTVQSFTTPDAPSVTTSPAAMVMSANAVLGGMANPNLADATGWFRYDTTHPGTCDDTFGVRAPATGGSALGAGGATVAFTQVASGLSPGTTYYFCAIAQNSVGTRFGAVVSFTTSTAPSVTTEAATDVTDASLTLHGSANPNLGDATGWFRYGETDPGTCNDTFGTRAPAMDGTVLGAGDTAVPFSEAITGLRPATTYYFCAIADNPAGTGFGDVMNVTTEAAAPIAVTVAPTDVRVTTATLNGEGTPNGADATGYFRYDTTDPGTCDDTFGTRAPEMDGAALGAGNAAVPFSTMLTGLTPDVVYYYCAVVETSLGRAFGEIMTFAPGSIAPEVVTEAATDVMGGSGTLHGSATANGTDTTAWFRIGDFEPTGCDDTFGRRVPDAAGSAIGADFDPVAFEQEASSLEPNVTYYYCAAASNLGGATFGEVLSFTTPPAPPEVRTGVPMIGMMGMITLNGSADPRNSPTVGWFRYADTDPGACDDTFGTRAPLTGEVTVGDGRSERPFSQVATLTPGMYWVCAIAENEGGVGLGTPVVFVVPEDEVTMDGGCGCRVTGRPAPSRAWLAALAMLAVIVVRRRRRR